MKKAQELYHMARKTEIELQDLALDFYREYIRYFEEEAEEGSFYGRIYKNDIPEKLLNVFEELVLPLFEAEDFTITKKEAPPYLGACCIYWEIGWVKTYE